MKPKKIEDWAGDAVIVGVFCGRVSVHGGSEEAHFTPKESRRLRKALKRAEREIESRA